MDANGLSFWLLADAPHWRAGERVHWDAGCRALALASQRRIDAPVDAAAFAVANSAIEAIPRAADRFGGVARWDAAAGAVVVHSHLPGDVLRLLLAEAPTDLCAGHDDVLYVVNADRVLMHDLRGRFADTAVPMAGIAPWRVAPAADGGLWMLERGSGRVARLSGRPMPLTTPARDAYAPGVFRPEPENCRPPRVDLLSAPLLAAGETPVAIAACADRVLGLLAWGVDGQAQLHLLRQGAWAPARVLGDARYAYAFDWFDDARLAVRMPLRRDAPAFDLGTGVGVGSVGSLSAPGLLPLGTVYPLPAGAGEAPFVHRLDGPPCVPLADGSAEPLLPLSRRFLATTGEARHWVLDAEGEGAVLDAHLLDSGRPGTVWHRLQAEASIPPGCAFVVWLAATADAAPPATDDAAWQPHAFGSDAGLLAGDDLPPETPRAAWERAPSELPGHAGVAPWPRERDRSGLFGVLIQHGGRQVRRLTGRFLWVRVVLYGNVRSTPMVSALRAYAGRFDYVDHYLPRLYRERLSGLPEAGPLPLERQRATPSDFLSRLLANFEGVLTTLEDRVAAAHLLSDPAVAPAAQLDWLGTWIGVAFDAVLPAAHRRAWLQAAPLLARWHGTRRGLSMALDVATGASVEREASGAIVIGRQHPGGVGGGEIVVIEDFRLRRLVATLLGVDLADEDDPLLGGLVRSGNSVVGDTLVLGDHETTELLALFRDDVSTETEDAAVRRFYARLAHRVTVLVHQAVEPQDLGLIRRIADAEAPAHVQVRVATATWPLLVGVASLVGVDTYLGPPRPRRPARVQVSALGGGDIVVMPAVLDPRMAGASAPLRGGSVPVADAGADQVVPYAESFVLDGGGSHATAPGAVIDRFIWRLLPPDAA